MTKQLIVSVDDTADNIIIHTPKPLAETITHDLVGYNIQQEANHYCYTIPVYANNCYVLASLFSAYSHTVACEQRILDAIQEKANTLPRPVGKVIPGNYLGIACPPVESYLKAVKHSGADPMMRNMYKIPFSRLYEGYRILSNWEHPFLQKFAIHRTLNELIHFPINQDRTLKALTEIDLSELYSIYYGYQVNLEGFKKLKYNNPLDILLKRPRRYIDRANITAWNQAPFGESIFVKGKLLNIRLESSKKLAFILEEEMTKFQIDMTMYGGAYLLKQFTIGDPVVVECIKVRKALGSAINLYNLPAVKAMPIEPIYPQSATNRITNRVILQAIEELFHRFQGGDQLLSYLNILNSKETVWNLIKQLHFPLSVDAYRHTIEKLAFVELVFLQLLFYDRKIKDGKAKGCSKMPTGKTEYTKEAIKNLPFQMTKGQQEAVQTFIAKLKTDSPEKMLLSADVGSGKTLCAQLACLHTADAGYQSVLMAPTDILAQQLYNTFIKLIKPLSQKPTIAFFSGKLKQKEREQILEGIANGTIDCVVGTQALTSIQDFHNLGLIVIDEQQKFGSEQREKLLHVRADGIIPDFISQTATPIPRTTALAFYGDIDLIQITEKPMNRKSIYTALVQADSSLDFLEGKGDEFTWRRILDELEAGHQLFIVAPAVEEDAKMISVKQIASKLKRFQQVMRIAEVSGKDKKEKQEKILTEFRDGKYNVLIASSIIEVGIDVPNATVVLILGADRFGASSLHQIRGRVGRSDLQSYCYLVSDSRTPASISRLQSLVQSEDGFSIALADLHTRSEGDILGTRQSGDSKLRFCDLTDHSKLIEAAKTEAIRLYNSDYRPRAIEDAKYFLRVEEDEQ